MPQATGPGLMGGWAPHQARILFPGQFSLEHLILGPLLLNCLFQSKYLCTQLQDLVLLSLGDGQKENGRAKVKEKRCHGQQHHPSLCPSLFNYFGSHFLFLPSLFPVPP